MIFFGLVGLFLMPIDFAFGQTASIAIHYTESAKLEVNNIAIDTKTTLKKLTDLLGQPSRVEEHVNGESGCFYDELGVVIFLGSNEMASGLGVNFNWDGDKKFPETSFTGTLKLAATTIDTTATSATIAGEKYIDFVCPFPSLCASKDKKSKVNCTVAFKDDRITQVVFLLK